MTEHTPNTPMPMSPYIQTLPTSGTAVASLVLSILGWFMLPIVGPVVALVLGYSARQQTRAVPPTASGDGMATAGIVLSWINLGLITCSCLAFGALMMLGIAGPVISTINNSLP